MTVVTRLRGYAARTRHRDPLGVPMVRSQDARTTTTAAYPMTGVTADQALHQLTNWWSSGTDGPVTWPRSADADICASVRSHLASTLAAATPDNVLDVAYGAVHHIQWEPCLSRSDAALVERRVIAGENPSRNIQHRSRPERGRT